MNDETIFEKAPAAEKPQPKKAENNKPMTDPIASRTPMPNAGKSKKGGIAAAAVAGAAVAGGAGVAFGSSKPFQEFVGRFGDSESESEAATDEEVGSTSASGSSASSSHLTGHDLEVATGVDDSMSFSEAFAAAREEVGPGGVFEWHGHTYGTYYENEWNSMSPEDKEQYWADVHHTTSHMDENLADNPEPPMDEPEPPMDEPELPMDEPELPMDEPELPVDEPEPPMGDPEPYHEPFLTDDRELILTPEEVYEELDLDGDGLADVAIVDADGNDIPDVVIDTTGDGIYDTLAQDVVAMDEEVIVPLGDVQEIQGVAVIDEFGCGDDGQAFTPEEPAPALYDPQLDGNPDLDPLASNSMDPDIPIDNNMDMDQFV